MKILEREIIFNADGSCTINYTVQLDMPIHFIHIPMLVDAEWPSGGTVDAADLKSVVAKTT